MIKLCYASLANREAPPGLLSAGETRDTGPPFKSDELLILPPPPRATASEAGNREPIPNGMRLLPSSRKARRWLAFLLCLTAWLTAYHTARVSRILIHRVSYGGGEIFHQVSTGDFGPGMAQGPLLPHVLAGSYLHFAPLRRVEAAAWDYIPRNYTFPDLTGRPPTPAPSSTP